MFGTRRFRHAKVWLALVCFSCGTLFGQSVVIAAESPAAGALKGEIRNVLQHASVVALLSHLGYEPAAVERVMARCSSGELRNLRDSLQAISPRRVLEQNLLANGHTRANAREMVAALSAQEVDNAVTYNPQRGGYFVMPVVYWAALLAVSAVLLLRDFLDLTPYGKTDDPDAAVVRFVREQYEVRKAERLKTEMQKKEVGDPKLQDNTKRLEELLRRKNEKPALPPL